MALSLAHTYDRVRQRVRYLVSHLKIRRDVWLLASLGCCRLKVVGQLLRSTETCCNPVVSLLTNGDYQ